MASVKFFKVATLPATLQPDSFYFVQNGTYAESFITNSSGDGRAIGNSAMINSLISSALASYNAIEIASDITARNSMGASASRNLMVLVLDASGDTTVAAGAALYAYNHSNSTWTKVAEYESMDLTVTWAMIQGKPSSSPSAIDSAVANSHTHANKSTLDLIGADSEGLLYNGAAVSNRWVLLNW